jgi:hypothetical protein
MESQNVPGRTSGLGRGQQAEPPTQQELSGKGFMPGVVHPLYPLPLDIDSFLNIAAQLAPEHTQTVPAVMTLHTDHTRHNGIAEMCTIEVQFSSMRAVVDTTGIKPPLTGDLSATTDGFRFEGEIIAIGRGDRMDPLDHPVSVRGYVDLTAAGEADVIWLQIISAAHPQKQVRGIKIKPLAPALQ